MRSLNLYKKLRLGLGLVKYKYICSYVYINFVNHTEIFFYLIILYYHNLHHFKKIESILKLNELAVYKCTRLSRRHSDS